MQDERALHVAVQNNHIEVVDLLLGQSNTAIDKRNKVWPSMADACMYK